jgi:adenylyl-sulfate kinase
MSIKTSMTTNLPRAKVIWITGISGSGKSTICDWIQSRLAPFLPHLIKLDGDAIRSALGADLSYVEKDRFVQISRIQRIAKMLADQGQIVLVGALYAHSDLLEWNRMNLPGYTEVYLNASLDVVRQRDPKGLYAKAAAGEMPDVVGLDIPWHAPENPDLKIDVLEGHTIAELGRTIIDLTPDLAKFLPTEPGE